MLNFPNFSDIKETKWKNAGSDSLLRQAENYDKKLFRTTVHYNSPSILLEDKAWMTNVKTNEDMVHVGIVDPEIGSMALAAHRENVAFGYLHLVSNNLVKKYPSDLGNERLGKSPEERKNAYRELVKILISAIQDIVD